MTQPLTQGQLAELSSVKGAMQTAHRKFRNAQEKAELAADAKDSTLGLQVEADLDEKFYWEEYRAEKVRYDDLVETHYMKGREV